MKASRFILAVILVALLVTGCAGFQQSEMYRRNNDQQQRNFKKGGAITDTTSATSGFWDRFFEDAKPVLSDTINVGSN